MQPTVIEDAVRPPATPPTVIGTIVGTARRPPQQPPPPRVRVSQPGTAAYSKLCASTWLLPWKPSGIPVRLHWMLPGFWVASAVLGALSGGWRGLLMHMLTHGPLLWAVVLLHELCHCWVARRVGGVVDEILLWPLGGLAFVGRIPSALSDMKVAAAGPACHVPIAMLCLALFAASCAGDLHAGSRASAADNFGAVFLWKFMWINTVLLAFNLFVPCFPLDGGRVFADALLLRGLSADAAATWVVRVSVPIIVGLIAYGVYALADGGPMTFLTLFTTVWLVRQTFDLHSAIGQGVIHQHPLFAHAQGVPARPVQPAVAPVGGGSGGTLPAVTGERV